MTLHTQRLKTPAEVQAFVSGNEAISFTLTDRVAADGWMTDTLKQFRYARCSRADKGVYLINALDEVTQFQAVFAVERISEAHLLPALEAMMDAFPFVIKSFHSDNGSEYINHHVAKLLEKLRIEQTKSRSRQTNDNALAESKNASTVRKYLGYSHIPRHFASQVNTFTVEVMSPYLNYHRPCHFPTKYQNKKGKIRKRYRY